MRTYSFLVALVPTPVESSLSVFGSRTNDAFSTFAAHCSARVHPIVSVDPPHMKLATSRGRADISRNLRYQA